MVFSNTTDNNGIVQQTRDFMRVDSTQWATQKIVNSCNNWLDKLTGYALATDRQIQWDDTNHTAFPIGTIDSVANQAEYSYLTDQQGNKIVTLTRVEVLGTDGKWVKLDKIDQAEIDDALSNYLSTAGTPQKYDITGDNWIKLYPAPATSTTGGIRLYFQRTSSYFVATDTTKEPGVSPLLHRGFVISSAYDGALTLGLNNLQALSVELEKEEQKMIMYFRDRNLDSKKRFIANNDSNK